MRHTVLPTAVAFKPRFTWARRPVIGIARRTSRLVLAWLDRRRAAIDAHGPASS